MLNSMTGVFCVTAAASAQRDHEQFIQSVRSDEKTAKELFKRLDEEGSGSLTWIDFEEKFEDVEVKAFLHTLDLEPSDAWSLFKLLDDGAGSVDVSQFYQGCLKLRGAAKSIDIASLMQSNKQLHKRARDVDKKSDAIFQQLIQMGRSLAYVTAEIGNQGHDRIRAAVDDAVSDIFEVGSDKSGVSGVSENTTV
eukprot:TRINITY_DN47082_c1_g1_i1.p1 TRINITY_DN47082_c1_g1~~TRINITY_DN47082_c1_g1_i1.p1  ORF type:complete len:194 (-),score=33.05 TRINITY_DN47082_c1_g1_i1:199-780(-)